jgi:quercetin 2,3-dioxygenase
MRTIKKIHNAEYAPIQDLMTYSPLPSRTLTQIDPFLFLNHHGPQHYGPKNNGLPFGPHPHRGMETVIFILHGDILHEDSAGHKSVITAGGVQWMTAGSGLIHAETSSKEFREKGGNLEILQLWINLPARLKMTPPKYVGMQRDAIPCISFLNDKVTVNLIAGNWGDQKAALESLTDIHLNTIYFEPDGGLTIHVPLQHNIFFYVIRGKLNVNGTDVGLMQLAEFNNDNEELNIQAHEDSILLFGHAQPLNEPVVAQGPFVMNTQEQIQEAYHDYKLGKFGVWKSN